MKDKSEVKPSNRLALKGNQSNLNELIKITLNQCAHMSLIAQKIEEIDNDSSRYTKDSTIDKHAIINLVERCVWRSTAY